MLDDYSALVVQWATEVSILLCQASQALPAESLQLSKLLF